MEENEPFPELIEQLDLTKCSHIALEDAMKREVLPQNTVELINDSGNLKQEKQTMVYITAHRGVIVDENDQMRILHKYDSYDFEELSNNYKVCYSDNGYVFINEEWHCTNGQEVQITIGRYDAATKETTHLPGAKVKLPGVSFSILHNDRIYVITKGKSEHILFYDMKNYFWSKILILKESLSNRWRAAVVGKDIYFLNSKLQLFHLHERKLERVSGDELTKNDILLALNLQLDTVVFSIAAVHRWLYIFVAYSTFHVYCYDTESGIWTDIPMNFKPPSCSKHDSWLAHETAIMFENKIFFSIYDYKNCHLKLYEYDLCKDCVKESTRPSPKFFHLAIADVATEMLGANSEAVVFSD